MIRKLFSFFSSNFMCCMAIIQPSSKFICSLLDKEDVLEKIALKLNLDLPLILLPNVINTKEPETTRNEKDFEQNPISQAQVMKNIIFLYLFIST